MNLDKIREALTQKVIIKLDPQYCSCREISVNSEEAVPGFYYHNTLIVKLVLMQYDKSYVKVYGPGIPVIKYIPRISRRRRVPEDDWLLNKIIEDAFKEARYEL